MWTLVFFKWVTVECIYFILYKYACSLLLSHAICYRWQNPYGAKYYFVQIFLMDIMADNTPHWPLRLWNINGYRRNIKSIESPCTCSYVPRKPKKIICLQLLYESLPSKELLLSVSFNLYHFILNPRYFNVKRIHKIRSKVVVMIAPNPNLTTWASIDTCEHQVIDVSEPWDSNPIKTTKQIYHYNIIQNT